MNRYFYVPVTNRDVCHDGVSLQDHLRVVDPELYNKEQEYLQSLSRLSFENGRLSPIKVEMVSQYDQALELAYRQRLLARSLIIVLGDSGMYELASEEEIDPVDVELIQSYEVCGDDVAKIFAQNLDYPPCAMNFFDSYRKCKSKLKKNSSNSTPKKIFQKFPFFRGRNS